VDGRRLDVHRLTPGSPYSVEGCVTLCRACHGPERKLPYKTCKPRRPGVVLMSLEIDAVLVEQMRAYAKGRGERLRMACERAWAREMGNPPPPVVHPPLPPMPPPAPEPRRRKGR
jgi:hypothetical protein